MTIFKSTLLILSCTLFATGTTSTKIYGHVVLSNEQVQQENSISTVTIGSCFVNSQGKERCVFDKKNLNLDDNDTILIFFQGQQKTITCTRTQTPGNGWYGNCDDDAEDANFVETNGKIFGSIRIGTDICRISPGPSNVEEIECTPEDEFENEAPDEVDDDDDETGNGFRLFQGLASTGAKIRKFFSGGRQLNDDFATSQIDVMVVWTKEAECSQTYGFNRATTCTLNEITENNMFGLIDLAVAETNAAFAISGINTQIRLVHAYRHPDYVERGFYQGLTDIRKKNDKHLDDVHDKRTLYGADLVTMIVANNAFCGISNGGKGRPVSSTAAFSVVRYHCMTGYYSFSHEIAHNFGAAHDRGAEDSCDVSEYPGNNYGWRDPAGSFRSIMAYHCSTSQCDNNAGGRCTRVQMFSTPDKLYNGKPIGDYNNNVAQNINNYIHLVASFYPAMYCEMNTECNDDDDTTVDTCDTSKNSCVYTPLPPPPPTSAPTLAPGSYMESMLVSAVRDNVWTTVQLSTNYVSPIPVCTVQYGLVSGSYPSVVRMRNVGTTSFEVRLQFPGDELRTGTRNVHCTVVEEGQWYLPDGRKIEAQKFLSTVTDKTGKWIGEPQTYRHSYTESPIILGQVMTFNDESWSSYWARGLGSWDSIPDTSGFRAGKHVGDDLLDTRNDEMIGMIIVERGHETYGDVEIETGRTGKVINHFVIDGANSVSFNTPFSTAPAVIVASVVGVNGKDGCWTVLGPDATTSAFNVAVDEDLIIDDRSHYAPEVVDYFAVSSTDPVALSLSDNVQPSARSSVISPIDTPRSDHLSGDYLEAIVVTNVNDSWTTVSLDATYVSPVIVCSAKYDIASQIPVVVRLRNIGSTSFEIRLQNPGDINVVLPHDCHCLVAEEGNWELPDGRKMEARTYLSTVTDYTQNFVGEQQAYQNSYSSPPIILGQVMTYNDPQWSTFYASKTTSRYEPPGLDGFVAGKMVGEDPVVTRNAETIGIIIIGTGHATSSGIEIETGRTSTSVINAPTSYKFSTAFASPPAVTITSLVAMIGNNGGWGILAGDATLNTIVIAVDEDRLLDSERNHIAEPLDFIALSTAGLISLKTLATHS